MVHYLPTDESARQIISELVEVASFLAVLAIGIALTAAFTALTGASGWASFYYQMAAGYGSVAILVGVVGAVIWIHTQ